MEDYWGAKLPVKIGRENFDRRRYRLFPGRQCGLAGLHQGRTTRTSGRKTARQNWATEYNFPAFKAGDVIKGEFETTSHEPMQGFTLNLRRPQFQDRRVREALTYAYDFERMNRTLFYGLYKRTDSYFEGGELASSGLPQGRELEILTAIQGQAAARTVHAGVQAAGLRHAAGRRARICARPTIFSSRPAG